MLWAAVKIKHASRLNLGNVPTLFVRHNKVVAWINSGHFGWVWESIVSRNIAGQEYKGKQGCFQKNLWSIQTLEFSCENWFIRIPKTMGLNSGASCVLKPRFHEGLDLLQISNLLTFLLKYDKYPIIYMNLLAKDVFSDFIICWAETKFNSIKIVSLMSSGFYKAMEKGTNFTDCYMARNNPLEHVLRNHRSNHDSRDQATSPNLLLTNCLPTTPYSPPILHTLLWHVREFVTPPTIPFSDSALALLLPFDQTWACYSWRVGSPIWGFLKGR